MPRKPSSKSSAGKKFLEESSGEKKLFSDAPKPGSLLKPKKEIETEKFGTGDSSVYASGPAEEFNPNKDPWSFKDKDGVEVTVTESEKEEYLIAFTNDVPFCWELEMKHINFRAKLQAITPEQIRVIDSAIMQDIAEKVVPEIPAVISGRHQYYSAMMQTLSINDAEYVAGQYKNLDLSFDERVRLLRSEFDQRFKSMTFARWSALFKLLKTFETKRSICDANIANENFWSRVGSNSFRKPAYAV